MSVSEIIHHPLLALIVTIGSFLAAQWLQKKAGGNSLLNPVVIAIAAVVVWLVSFDIDYSQYLRDVGLIHQLLGPATVALAIPLYKQLPTIQKMALPIGLAAITACFVAAGVGYVIAHAMGAEEAIQLSIIPKSATMPIAIEIADTIGGDASLAVFFVFTTGIIGSVIALFIFKLIAIQDERIMGFALGTTCHGLGVARAFQISEKAGAFATLGMSLMGIVSGLALPVLVIWLL